MTAKTKTVHAPISYNPVHGIVLTACGCEVNEENARRIAISYERLSDVTCTRCSIKLEGALPFEFRHMAEDAMAAGHERLAHEFAERAVDVAAANVFHITEKLAVAEKSLASYKAFAANL